MNEKTAKALKPYDSIVTATMSKIQAMQNKNQIQFPGDYSPANALQSAWLILQETKDKDKKLVLETCNKSSIANALLDMVVSGLNPAKKQGYFIAYGKQLSFQRSYFGAMALAKRVDPDIQDIIAEVIFDGDKFEYEIVKGQRQIASHKQNLEAVDSQKIKGAYCMVIGKNGDVKKTEIMTFDEIKKSWTKSKAYPVQKNGDLKAGTVHEEYTVEMCKRTVINRACKPIINSSSDKVLLESVNRSDMMEVEAQAEQDIEEGANQKVVDIDDRVIDAEFEPETSPDTEHVEERNDGENEMGNTPGNTPDW